VTTFKALLVTQADGKSTVSITQIARDALPPGDVLIRITYSCLNYKDGLALRGEPRVIRKFPMIPGIDFAGIVEESATPEFKPGDSVVVTGSGTSETMWGGYAEFARLDAKYIVPLPKKMSLKQAMGIGTAGFTAMQAVLALEHHGLEHLKTAPSESEILVTGAAGGLGSIAVAILAKLGYKVAASTGRPEHHDYLRSLGTTSIVSRAELAAPSDRPLEAERWGAAIDSVGGDTLASVLRSMRMRGSVAVCGLAGGSA